MLHGKVNLPHRAEDRIHRECADGVANSLLGRHVAGAALHVEFHVERALIRVQRREMQVRVDDLKVRRCNDVPGVNLTGASGLKAQPTRSICVGAQPDGLHPLDHLHHLLLQVGKSGVLMQHTINADPGDGGTGYGAHQHPAKRVAQRGGKAPLQRFQSELAVGLVQLNGLDVRLGNGWPSLYILGWPNHYE